MGNKKLVELSVIPDIFITGLAHIETAGGNCLRFVGYVVQQEDGKEIRVHNLSVIMPKEELPDAIQKALAVAAESVAKSVRNLLPGIH